MTRSPKQTIELRNGGVEVSEGDLPFVASAMSSVPGSFTSQTSRYLDGLDVAGLGTELEGAISRSDKLSVECIASLSFDLKDYPTAIKAYAHLRNVELTEEEIQMVSDGAYNFAKTHFTVKDQYLSLLSSLLKGNLTELNENGMMISNLGDDLLFKKIIDLLLENQLLEPAQSFCWYMDKGNQPESLRAIAACAEKSGDRKLASRTYAALGDHANQKRLILEVLNDESVDYLTWGYGWRDIEEGVCFFRPEQIKLINAALKRWVSALDLRVSHDFWEPELVAEINMAYECLPKYDLVVAIANAGLTPALVFKLAGMDVKVMEDHSDFFEFSPHTPVSKEALRGKKILLLENDIRSGLTMQMVFKALEAFEPAEVSVFFSHHDPGRVDRIPQDYSFYGRQERNSIYGFSRIEERIGAFQEKIA